MLEKRRVLELSHRINNWLFSGFLFIWLILLGCCFLPLPKEFIEALYTILLIVDITLGISISYIYIMALVVHISDKIGSPRILIVNTVKLVLITLFTTVAMILKELMVYGI